MFILSIQYVIQDLKYLKKFTVGTNGSEIRTYTSYKPTDRMIHEAQYFFKCQKFLIYSRSSPFYETRSFQYAMLCIKLLMKREGERREREGKVFNLTCLSIVKITSRRKQINVI